MTAQPPNHVLMTADTVGGIWTYAMELTKGLAASGVHVSLATMGGPLSPAQADDAAALPNLQVFESRYRLEWMKSPWKDISLSSEWLLHLEQKLQPDIVHLNTYAHGALPWSAPHLVVGHSCVLSWWRAVLGEDCGRDWGKYKKAVTQGLRSARYIVAPSWAMLKALYTHYSPMPAGHVIRNGRSADLFSPAAKEPFILTAGRLWDKAKNIQILDRIAADIPWPIHIAGEPRQPGTQERSDFGSLELLGCLSSEELRVQYAKAGIYVAPAKYEPFGLSILEAALSGCPLVLGNISSLRELWEGAAVFVDPNNPDQLRKELIRLIESPWARKGLAISARKRALNHSTSRMADAYMRVYRSMLRSGTNQQLRHLRLAAKP